MTRIFTLLSAFILTFATSASADQPRPKEINFQEAVTPVMERITDFHNLLLWIISGIVLFVMILLIYVMVRFSAKVNPEPSKTTHNVPLEIVWTLVPVLILLVIAIPSFRLLFYSGITPEADMTIKAIGNQWNWSYEYPDHGDISFTSVMVPTKDLKEGQVQLLSTDNVVVLPVDTVVRIQVTASDVLHSFAVPAFGIKVDAVPGRLNETWAEIKKPGVYYGQCSELCGKDHGFMPIEVHAVSKEDFAAWVAEKGGKMPMPVAAEAPVSEVPANTDDKIQSPKEEGQPVATPVTPATPATSGEDGQ